MVEESHAERTGTKLGSREPFVFSLKPDVHGISILRVVRVKLDHLQPIEVILFQKIFNFFHLHTGRPILIAPEG